MVTRFIVETGILGKQTGTDPKGRATVVAGEPFHLRFAVTSEDGAVLADDMPILVGLQFCSWLLDGKDQHEPGMQGFELPGNSVGPNWIDAFELTIPKDRYSAVLDCEITAPLRGQGYTVEVHGYFFAKTNGSLVGHVARQIAVEAGPREEGFQVPSPAVFPDGEAGEDLRLGVGWIELLGEPLPHPTVTLYASCFRGVIGLAASQFCPPVGPEGIASGPTPGLRMYDLGWYDDPSADPVLGEDGTLFSLPRYLTVQGETGLRAPAQWEIDDTRLAAARLRAKLPTAFGAVVEAALQANASVGDRPAPSIMVVTDDLLFPWELVGLDLGVDGAPARLLGQIAAVSRWQLHVPLPSHVTVSRAVFVAPLDNDISAFPTQDRDELAGQEAACVKAMATRCWKSSFRKLSPPTIDKTVRALDGDRYQLFHLRSHGTRYGVQLAAVTGNFEPAVFSLRPRHLPGRDREREHNRPFIFVNICGGSFSQSEAWTEALIAYGCGGAVVTSWNIDSELSFAAAELFYGELAAGKPVAEAMRTVRGRYDGDLQNTERGQADPTSLANRLRSNSTVLSYVVLGHPATMLRPAAVTPSDQAPSTNPHAPR